MIPRQLGDGYTDRNKNMNDAPPSQICWNVGRSERKMRKENRISNGNKNGNANGTATGAEIEPEMTMEMETRIANWNSNRNWDTHWTIHSGRNSHHNETKKHRVWKRKQIPAEKRKRKHNIIIWASYVDAQYGSASQPLFFSLRPRPSAMIRCGTSQFFLSGSNTWLHSWLLTHPSREHRKLNANVLHNCNSNLEGDLFLNAGQLMSQFNSKLNLKFT